MPRRSVFLRLVDDRERIGWRIELPRADEDVIGVDQVPVATEIEPHPAAAIRPEGEAILPVVGPEMEVDLVRTPDRPVLILILEDIDAAEGAVGRDLPGVDAPIGAIAAIGGA